MSLKEINDKVKSIENTHEESLCVSDEFVEKHQVTIEEMEDDSEVDKEFTKNRVKLMNRFIKDVAQEKNLKFSVGEYVLIIPSIFSLLKSKDEIGYNEMLKLLKARNGEGSDKLISMLAKEQTQMRGVVMIRALVDRVRVALYMAANSELTENLEGNIEVITDLDKNCVEILGLGEDELDVFRSILSDEGNSIKEMEGGIKVHPKEDGDINTLSATIEKALNAVGLSPVVSTRDDDDDD